LGSTSYNALESEFVVFDELLKARNIARLTQRQVAERMGTKSAAIAKLESGGAGKKHSPSIETLGGMLRLLVAIYRSN